MNELTRLIRNDCKPSLGVTEPGAIALAVATAKKRTRGTVREIHLALNSGMYKNAFTCGIPGTREVGFLWAAALGAVAGKAEKELEALENIDEASVSAAKALLDAGAVTAEMTGIDSEIYIGDGRLQRHHPAHAHEYRIDCVKRRGASGAGA